MIADQVTHLEKKKRREKFASPAQPRNFSKNIFLGKRFGGLDALMVMVRPDLPVAVVPTLIM